MGKSDRALLIGVICIVYYFTENLDPYMNYLIGFSCVLMIVSSFIRLKKSLEKWKK